MNWSCKILFHSGQVKKKIKISNVRWFGTFQKTFVDNSQICLFFQANQLLKSAVSSSPHRLRTGQALPFLLFREEYGKLFDFVNAKKLNIKNRGFKEVTRLSFTTRAKVWHILPSTTSCPVIDTCCSSCVCPSTPVEEGGYSRECDTESTWLVWSDSCLHGVVCVCVRACVRVQGGNWFLHSWFEWCWNWCGADKSTANHHNNNNNTGGVKIVGLWYLRCVCIGLHRSN